MTTAIQKTDAGIQGLLQNPKIQAQIQRALPEHMTADRMTRVALTALLKTPKLAECSQASFMQAMLDCSSLGLEPDGRRAHLIPYKTTCQLIVDWKGLVELAKRSGEVAAWSSYIVYENDEYSFEDFVFKHSADPFADRGKPIGAVSVVTLKSGHTEFELMTANEIKAIQARSKAGNSGPWITDELEMWKKTVIRRHSKRLTLSPEFHHALEKDADRFPEIRNVTPRSKELSSNSNPFLKPSQPEPESLTLNQLMVRDKITEAQVLDALSAMKVIEAETPSLESLTPELQSDAAKSWDMIINEINK